MNMYLTLQNPKIRIQNALKIGWSAILFIALWLGISLSVLAQPAYTFSAASGTFTSIVGQAGTVNVASVEADDAVSAPLPIGFTFTYDGVAYTQIKAASNGWMTFNTTATASALTNSLSGFDNTIRPLLAPLWDDLDGRATGGSTSSYLTEGVVGSRIFTMEWLNWEWRYNSTNPVISFQVKLYEDTGVIEYVYRQEAEAVNSGSASIGLTKSTTGGGQYFSLSGSGAAPTVSSTVETSSISTKPATGQIYRWSPKLFSLSPSDNATLVAPDANLVVTFSSGTPVIGTGNIQIKKTSDNSVVETITLPSAQVTVVGRVVTINPNVVLDCNTEYYVNIPASAITGVAGFTGITNMTDWSFTTTNVCYTLSPADNATGIAPNISPAMTFLFGTPVIGTGTIELRKTTGGVLVESFVLPSARVTVAGNVVTIDPTALLECNTEYYLTVPSTAVTGTGVTTGITSTTAWSFTTLTPAAPAPYAYTTIPVNFESIATTGTAVTGFTSADGISTATITMPTAFPYFGTDYTQFKIGADGWITFDITQTGGDFSNSTIPDADGPPLMIAPFWDDLDASITGTVRHQDMGTYFLISFENVERWLESTTNNFQIKLFYATGVIEFHYGTFNTAVLNSATVGIENATETVGVLINFNGTGDALGSNTAFRISPVTPSLPLTATFSPADNSIGVAPNSNLVIDFPYLVSVGTGNITIHNVTTNAVLETIPVGDARVTFNGGQVTINPTINLPSNTPIAVQFALGAFKSCNNLSIAGITDNTTWNFTTLDCSSLSVNAGADQSANLGATVNLSAIVTGGVGATYAWTPTTGLNDATLANPTITGFTATTTYTVTVTNTNGCQATDAVVITSVCDALIVNAGSDQSVASGSDVTFVATVTGATGALTYAWTPAAGLSDATVLNPTFTGFTIPTTFTLTVTDAGTGCVKTDNVLIGIAATGGGGGTTSTATAPSLRITSLNSTSLRLNWTGGSAENYAIYRSVTAFGGNFTRVGQVGSAALTYLDSMLMPNTRYYYYVQAIRGGAIANSNTVSDFTYPSTPRVASFQNACLGTGAQFTVRGSTGVYTVYSAATGGTAVASGDSTGVITTPTFADSTMYYISAVGSRYESTPRVAVRVITRPLPTATLLGAAVQESCTDSLTIKAQAVEGATYTWYSSDTPVATTSTPMYLVSSSGIYSVLVNKAGCVARSSSVIVRLNRVSPAQIRGLATRQFCEMGSLEAVMTEGATYEWQRNNVVVGTNSSLEVSQSGVYTVTVTSVLGCVLTSTPVTVTIISVPQLDLQTSAADFCEGTDGVELTVNAVSGATYEWLRNGRRIRTTSTSSLQVNVGGEYRVRVILNGTCSRTSDFVTVTRNVAPAASVRIYGDSIKVVYVGNVAITSITWTKDDAPFSATTQAFVPTESGIYTATVTYETGCEVVTSGIEYIKRPEPPIVLGEEDVEALGFMLFPNPTTSKVNLSFGDAFKGDITLTLTDAIGRTIQVIKVKATENATIDLSAVANGNYMLKIASADKVVTRKIIRE